MFRVSFYLFMLTLEIFFGCLELTWLFHVSTSDWVTESETLLFFFSRAWRPYHTLIWATVAFCKVSKHDFLFCEAELFRSIKQILHLQEVQLWAHFENSLFLGLYKLCHPAMPDRRTWRKYGENGKDGKHQPDDLKHPIYPGPRLL